MYEVGISRGSCGRMGRHVRRRRILFSPRSIFGAPTVKHVVGEKITNPTVRVLGLNARNRPTINNPIVSFPYITALTVTYVVA